MAKPAVKPSSHSLSNVTKTKGVNFYRDAKTVRKLGILKSGRVKRDKDGQFVSQEYQARLPSGSVARVEPNRRWFENTRVVGQKELDGFRAAIQKTEKDPFAFVMRTKQLPLGLVVESEKEKHMHLLDADPFNQTFGPKAQRKKPKLVVSDMAELASRVEEKLEGYESDQDKNIVVEDDGIRKELSNPIFAKGQSKRIWNELYKVMDSSDVILHVLDARDPMGTRCRNVEKHLRTEARHKQLVFILNKCDLVPTWVTVSF